MATALALPVCAETTPAPPDWPDGKSVYLGMKARAIAEQPARATTIAAVSAGTISTDALTPPGATFPKLEAAVAPSVHDEPVAPAAEAAGRRLAPPSTESLFGRTANQASRASGSARRLVQFGLPTESIYTIVTALTIVVGTFLLFAWVMRRGTRRSAAILPADVVSVLGRVPIAARQFAELLRVGNKLVLVSLTPSGAEPLTEVTDPAEVDRLIGLCQQYDPHSTTKAFEQVFQQLSSEPARGGFFGSDSLPPALSPVAGAYRAHRGDSTRG